MATGSSSNPELARALHQLRSTLARMRAEAELAADDGNPPPVDRILGDLHEALELLSDVEAAALSVVRVVVIDDDARLGELTARSLRRMGFDAESSASMRPLRPHDVVVLDLGLAESLQTSERSALRETRPIVVTGAADPASRALAADLDACDYLIKPVEMEVLAAAIKRRADQR